MVFRCRNMGEKEGKRDSLIAETLPRNVFFFFSRLLPNRWWLASIYSFLLIVGKKWKFKCNLFTHGALRCSQELVLKFSCIPESNCNLEKLVFKERSTPEFLERNLYEQRREPTTNLAHTWRRVWESNVRHIRMAGELPDHCAQSCSRFGQQHFLKK